MKQMNEFGDYQPFYEYLRKVGTEIVHKETEERKTRMKEEDEMGYWDLWARDECIFESDNLHKKCGSKVKHGMYATYCPKCKKKLDNNTEVVWVHSHSEKEVYELEKDTMVALSWE